ncbi:MAG: hypothetical protein COA45_10290 [Zetaproteobacteria bacterium]|nr:MAG: hypothetical protein COA45_10290 [Zetaproteobacteria bacterium]
MRLFENKYDEHQDNIKRLADSLNLAALCMRKMGRHPQMAAIHAAKFYQLSGSHRSEMRAAQDVADDFIDCGDALAARQTMEQHVLPVLRNFGFEASTMDVYGQYAVILAYCGKYASGRSEMAKLQAYVAELPSKYQDGFANQCNMIDQIEAGLIKLPSREVNMLPLCVPQSSQRKVKIGRNVPCPCGSGKKYKKCCLI